MEYVETRDPEKSRLIEASERHKRELEREVKNISDKTERMLINGLIIGGSLALTYFVVSQWGGSRKKKKNKSKGAAAVANEDSAETESTVDPRRLAADENVALLGPSFISQIGTKVINQATLILLDLAKEKLMEFLESRKQRNENS